MKPCAHCAAARVRTWGHYETWCNGCMARAVARSSAAFHALDSRGKGEQEPLRDLVRRMLPEFGVGQALAMVAEWWKVDHEHQAAEAPTA